ncbi:MAG TPA: ion channel [Xanthomonadaceae bacterium]|nr:ion channel [Xanthomonadaceae bacterium]
MSNPSTRRRRGVTVTLGKTEVTKLGEDGFSWGDVYHVIMSMTWPRFFRWAIGIYLLVNLVFASAYALGDHAVNNAHSFAACFFFSVETLATVGYGVMSPATTYGHVVATCEIVTGMMSMAVITGLLFARFSKPTARVLFSRVAVITPYDGVPTLMLRVANQRRSYILEAMASMVLARDVDTADGHSLRRFYDLKLERARSPMFALSWLIMHRIDADSPLHGVSEEALRAGDMALLITLSGIDETFAAGVHARYNYACEDILFGRRFVDVFIDDDDPRKLTLDMAQFHDVEAG